MHVLAEQNRTFGYATAASLALHGALLFMNAPATREILSPPPEAPLVARLAEPAAPPQAEPEQPAAPPPAPAPAPQKRTAKAKPKAKPAPRPSVPMAAPQPEVASEEPALPAEPSAPAPAVASIAPSPPAAPDPGEALARFRQQLVDLAVRYKRYPRVALDNGWTGNVQVRIEVAASGAVSSVMVKTSSGYEVLDAQALEMFRKAAQQIAVPGALRGKDFSVDVRAIYNLQDRPG